MLSASSRPAPRHASSNETPGTSRVPDITPFLTEGQQAALRSGSEDEIEYANEQALQMAIAASLQVDNQPSQAERLAQHKLTDKLKHWFDTHGYEVKPNSGNSNNCLIISMLQHVTGDYHSNHLETARHYKEQLAERSHHTIAVDQPLHSDTGLTDWLVDQINRDYFGDRRDRYLCFWMVTADLDGAPAVRSVGHGHRAMAILDGAGHYEAVVARTLHTSRAVSRPDTLP